jgi:hypothetical protein
MAWSSGIVVVEFWELERYKVSTFFGAEVSLCDQPDSKIEFKAYKHSEILMHLGLPVCSWDQDY